MFPGVPPIPASVFHMDPISGTWAGMTSSPQTSPPLDTAGRESCRLRMDDIIQAANSGHPLSDSARSAGPSTPALMPTQPIINPQAPETARGSGHPGGLDRLSDRPSSDVYLGGAGGLPGIPSATPPDDYLMDVFNPSLHFARVRLRSGNLTCLSPVAPSTASSAEVSFVFQMPGPPPPLCACR